MSSKKILCPLCEETVVLGKPTKSGHYFCPSCHGEIILQKSQRKIRERRAGVVVGGEVYGVKGSHHGNEPFKAADEPAAEAPRDEPEDEEVELVDELEPDEDFEEVDELDDEDEEDEPSPARRRKSGRSKDKDSTDRGRRNGGSSRNAARTAVLLVLLVLAGVVSAGVIWLQGLFGESGEGTADDGMRLKIPVASGDGDGSPQNRGRSGGRRDVDVDRLLEPSRGPSPEAEAIAGSGATSGTDTQAATSDPGPRGGDAATTVPRQGAVELFSMSQIDAAAEVAEDFVQARTAAERGKMIRNRETDLPLLLDFYQEHPDKLELVGDVGRMVTSPEDFPNIGFLVGFQNGRERFLGLEYRDGAFLVDWPSYEVYHEREWEHFVEDRITSPTLMRTFASPVDYYNYGFADEETYYCLRIENGRDPYGSEPLYGYIRRDHEDYERIVQLAEQAGSYAMPLVLRLRYPLLAETENQVEIVEFVSYGWMMDQ